MPSPPYDTLETILNAARVRLNDAIASLGGDIITDAQPFTLVMVNSGWRVLQNVLAGHGVERLKLEIILPNVPPVFGPDPVSKVSITWAGASDGTNPFIAPVLPQNMILPLMLWERQTGTTDTFLEMDKLINGLPSVPKEQWNLSWEWRGDTLYIPGAVVATDLRIRYLAYLPDFTSIVANPAQPVPIVHCLDAFSNFIAAEAAKARGDMDGAAFDTAGRAACALLAGRETPVPVVQQQQPAAPVMA
jgi:hypothetical protein